MNELRDVWPAEDPDSILIREVYARYGLAMYGAQVLEHTIVNSLLVLSFLPDNLKPESLKDWHILSDQFYSKELEKTFGRLVKTLGSINFVPRSIIGNLLQAKEMRDILAHSFFRNHDLAFTTDNGRQKMIVECEKIIDQFKKCDDELEEFCKPYKLKYGFTEERVNEMYQEMMMEAQQQFGD